jgi:hypothetical protein
MRLGNKVSWTISILKLTEQDVAAAHCLSAAFHEATIIETLLVSELMKTFACYGTRNFRTVLTKTSHRFIR